MNQNLWNPARLKERGGQSSPRWLSWPRCILYPALALGALIMVMALQVGVGHAAAGGHSWQKVRLFPGFEKCSAFYFHTWEKPCTTLTGDYDDDDGDDDGGDCPPTTT